MYTEMKIRSLFSSILIFLLLSSFFLTAQETKFETPGSTGGLPAFYEQLKTRMNYPLSWLSGGHGNFSTWRIKARNKVMESLLTAPPTVPFNAKIIAEEDRGTYIVRKIVLNITHDSRVLA